MNPNASQPIEPTQAPVIIQETIVKDGANPKEDITGNCDDDDNEPLDESDPLWIATLKLANGDRAAALKMLQDPDELMTHPDIIKAIVRDGDKDGDVDDWEKSDNNLKDSINISSNSEINEIFNILSAIYKNCRQVYQPIMISRDGNSISFVGDSYYDPVLTCLSLRNHGLLELTYHSSSSEQDRVVITGGNVSMLRKLAELPEFPDWKTCNKILNELGIPKSPKYEPKSIILVSVDGGDHEIAIEDWKRYWEYFGKTGPSSQSYIPSVEQFYETLMEINKK